LTLSELYSSHVLEHLSIEAIEGSLPILKYWFPH
jgi:hypothetical protein